MSASDLRPKIVRAGENGVSNKKQKPESKGVTILPDGTIQVDGTQPGQSWRAHPPGKGKKAKSMPDVIEMRYFEK